MFEIKCVVRDKHLPHVLRALEGATLEPPVVIPIADEANGAADPAVSKTHKMNTLDVEAFVRSQNNKKVTVKQLKEFAISRGAHVSSYSFHTNKLLKKGVLKKTSMRGVYEVKA